MVICNRREQGFVFLNDGTGNFSEKKPFGGPLDSNVTVLAADTTDSGKLDLVLARRDGQQSVVLLNDGQANFDSAVPFGPPDADTRAIAVGRLLGGARVDIVACHLGIGTFIYAYAKSPNRRDGGAGRHGGGYSAVVKLADGADNFFCLQVADLRLAGCLDIVAGNTGSRRSVVFFNNAAQGDTTTAAASASSASASGGGGGGGGDGRRLFTPLEFGEQDGAETDTYGLAVADLTGDGFPDIVVARSGGPSGVFFSDPAA